jgi:hypothetical protein
MTNHASDGNRSINLGAQIAAHYVNGGGDVFHPDRWADYKGGFWWSAIFALEATAVVALSSSLAVVYYFRARFRNDKPVA